MYAVSMVPKFASRSGKADFAPVQGLAPVAPVGERPWISGDLQADCLESQGQLWAASMIYFRAELPQMRPKEPTS